MYIADLAGAAPASAPPSTTGDVFCILVGTFMLCGGLIIAADHEKMFSRNAKVISRGRRRDRPPRIYGGPPAGPVNLRVMGLFFFLAGSGVVAVGVYFLSR